GVVALVAEDDDALRPQVLTGVANSFRRVLLLSDRQHSHARDDLSLHEPEECVDTRLAASVAENRLLNLCWEVEQQVLGQERVAVKPPAVVGAGAVRPPLSVLVGGAQVLAADPNDARRPPRLGVVGGDEETELPVDVRCNLPAAEVACELAV